ncbi:CHAT domain-containing protein [Agriterribacter sp.]|uniref:CHAT domain-containing protein n=1 Tax=Agriterribacter sp. TaxID=2821509 RepID=UPI002C7B06EC|nr:CHAT domain-containing protein [Agriterribacter sp.]HRP55934.1 CHAT domain-containing protein [Agriterribacter sp.]
MLTGGNIFLRIVTFQLLTVLFLSTHCFSQCHTGKDIWSSILALENAFLTNAVKLQQAYRVKHEFEHCKLSRDSVYARLLHRIATLEFLENGNKATKESVEYMLRAIAINNSDAPGSSPGYAVNSYYNLAVFYSSLDLNNKALDYYDSVIISDNKLNLHSNIAIECRVGRADILFKNGDFQKCVDECTAGLAVAKYAGDAITMMQLFNRRGQSYVYLDKPGNAGADADSALHYAGALGDDFEWATAAKIKALIYAGEEQFDKAVLLFNKAIRSRKRTNEYAQVADDYTDLGNFYFQYLKQYRQAQDCYFKTVEFAQKAGDTQRMCKGYINLGEVAFRLQQDHRYTRTENYYRKALEVYGLNEGSLLQDPVLSRLSVIGNTDLLLVILNNKTELLLKLYKTNGDKQYLKACLSTAVLMDSAIAQARHEQLGEQSKLYWRNKTRSFFATALEACYVAEDMPKAFYFMEKSRAVLLSDKLNELGAATHLPASENALEQSYKAAIVYEQQKLARTGKQLQAYQSQQLKVIHAKEALEDYVKTLEQKYPVYYQYKYADDIPTLEELQAWLQHRGESFVHYFIQDTTAYILVSTPDTSRMIKLRSKELDSGDMDLFLQWCSAKQQLNNHFPSFAALAHKLYTSLFEPLHLPGGHVILCQDNFLLPFEALCKDDKGKQFLVYDYMFSYVYSARYLMKPFHIRKAGGDFIGFAPVSFAGDLGVPELRHSALSLAKAGAYYDNAKLFTQTAATRKNFLEQVAGYSIVNVFSHALADTGSSEPVLYMQDSVINLSELQLLSHPATQLIMLSACQTNVGKNATGEGIYSLARGFSSAGIPSVSATLWKADEETIYAISDAFHALLAKGMRKDEALQKAKLLFMESGGKEKLLPYYWANMVIIGSGDAVVLSSPAAYSRRLNAGIIFAVAIAVIILLVRVRQNIN